ncbi:hypothetical protein Ciccas_002534 [Cichlidogyrus casuarinus]|uniref:Uncharacterized protein n=1 Tax=Cichlidogyrus casuarinus TaxID=1844966 RepID=A0ABD2QH09_9PLAT
MSKAPAEESDLEDHLEWPRKLSRPMRREIVVDPPHVDENHEFGRRALRASIRRHRHLRHIRSLTNKSSSGFETVTSTLLRSQSLPSGLVKHNRLCLYKFKPRLERETRTFGAPHRYVKKDDRAPVFPSGQRYMQHKASSSNRCQKYYSGQQISTNQVQEDNYAVSAALLCRQSSDPNIRRLSVVLMDAATQQRDRASSILEQSKEKLAIQFCRISVLLITLKIALGVSVSAIGLTLNLRYNIEWSASAYWAGIPVS